MRSQLQTRRDGEVLIRPSTQDDDSFRESIAVAVATTFDNVPLSPTAWDTAVALLGGSVYMTWDWLRTWWRFYGKKCELRLYVCCSGQQVVGLIPLYIDEIGPWPLRLRVARLVGANIPPKVFDPPVAREWAVECFREVLRRSIGADRCDVISIGPVSGTKDMWRTFQQDMTGIGARMRVECDNRAVHTVFRLPQSQSEYLKSLSKNEQKNRRKYELRTLRKEHAVEVGVVAGPVERVVQEFDHFAELHQMQWQSDGKPGHFGAWPDALAYNRALVTALGRLDRVRFIRITAGGALVASEYLFSFAGRWYWEHPARLPGRDWDRFSLGPSGIVTMIGEAISAGVHWIQGGLGHYDYKLRLGAEEHRALIFRITASSVGSRVRNALYNLVRFALRLSYHKVWYRRIVPRLRGRVSRSQWPLWLRVDY